jgi:hypothetical protein
MTGAAVNLRVLVEWAFTGEGPDFSKYANSVLKTHSRCSHERHRVYVPLERDFMELPRCFVVNNGDCLDNSIRHQQHQQEYSYTIDDVAVVLNGMVRYVVTAAIVEVPRHFFSQLLVQESSGERAWWTHDGLVDEGRPHRNAGGVFQPCRGVHSLVLTRVEQEGHSE